MLAGERQTDSSEKDGMMRGQCGSSRVLTR